MKLHEFRECIDKLDDYYQKEEFVEIQGKKFPIAKGDPYICVPVVTEETYIGPRPSTSVCLVEEGFDWEQGCIYLVTEKDVCLKKVQMKQVQKFLKKIGAISVFTPTNA